MLEYQKLPHRTATFACINSGKGFINYFEKFFNKANKLYIIKGGPGTGKSSLMRAIDAEAERRGIHTLPILCSSDPTSLDGLYLPSLGIAIADGTAPHTMDTHLPGAREQLIDLGSFWDETYLFAQKEKITAYAHEKAKGYARAFHFFAAANEVETAAHDRLSGYVDHSKLYQTVVRTAERILPLVPRGNRQYLPQKALSMAGAVKLTCPEQAAKKIFSVEPFYGVERIFMEALSEKTSHLSSIISPDPVTLSPDSIYFPAAGVLFRISEKEGVKTEKTISTARFADLPKGERSCIRNYRKETAILVKHGLSELSTLSEKHFLLERIYGEAMDFSQMEKLKEELISKIFN